MCVGMRKMCDCPHECPAWPIETCGCLPASRTRAIYSYGTDPLPDSRRALSFVASKHAKVLALRPFGGQAPPAVAHPLGLLAPWHGDVRSVGYITLFRSSAAFLDCAVSWRLAHGEGFAERVRETFIIAGASFPCAPAKLST